MRIPAVANDSLSPFYTAMQFPMPPPAPAEQVTPAASVTSGGNQPNANQLETKKTEIPAPQNNQSFKSQIKSAAAGQAMTMNIVNGKIQLTPVGGLNNSDDSSRKTSESSQASESKGETKSDSGKKECDKAKVLNNVTLKGGKKAGKFNNHGDVKGMEECQDICCKDDKCHVAFMLGKTCYSVTCKNEELCEHTKAPPTDFNPKLSYVRPMETSSKKGEVICQKNQGNIHQWKSGLISSPIAFHSAILPIQFIFLLM